jgi:hypothetical protein
MRWCTTIVGLSAVALVLGATVLCIFISGPLGIFGGPVFAIFGWFYLLPIVILVSLALAAIKHPFFQSGVGICLFVLSGALTGATFMAIFGVKEQGSFVLWTIAEAVGGGVSGAAVAGLIVCFRRLPDRDRPPTPPAR